MKQSYANQNKKSKIHIMSNRILPYYSSHDKREAILTMTQCLILNFGN